MRLRGPFPLLAIPGLVALYLATVAVTSLVVAPPRLDPAAPHAEFVNLAAGWQVDTIIAERHGGMVTLIAFRGEGARRRDRRAVIHVRTLALLLRDAEVRRVLAHRPGVLDGLDAVAASGVLALGMDRRSASAAPSPARR
jgi:hypothetical protein